MTTATKRKSATTFDVYGFTDRGSAVAVCSNGTADEVVAHVIEQRGGRWQHNPAAKFLNFWNGGDDKGAWTSPAACDDNRPGHKHYVILRSDNGQYVA